MEYKFAHKETLILYYYEYNFSLKSIDFIETLNHSFKFPLQKSPNFLVLPTKWICEQNIFFAPRQRVGVVEIRELIVNFIKVFASVSTVLLFSPQSFTASRLTDWPRALTPATTGRTSWKEKYSDTSFFSSHSTVWLVANSTSHNLFAAFGTYKCKCIRSQKQNMFAKI